MRKFLSLDFRRPRPEDRLSLSCRNVSYLMLLMFTVGILAGAAVGLYSPPTALSADVESYVFTEVLPRSVWAALWGSCRFFLLLLALSTSWLGVVLSPAAVLMRGYLLSCSVSVLFSAYAYRGLFYSFLISGIPALFIAPCFLVAACDAFFSSRRLLTQRFGGDHGFRSHDPMRHGIVITFLILLDTAYAFYLLPLLLGAL